MAREGANIVAVDVCNCMATKQAVEAQHAKALSLEADVSVEQAAKDMVSRAVEAFGRLDILVNNAAISPQQPVDEITFEDWRKVLSVDLDGVFLCLKAAIPQMKKQHYGRIINVTSSTVFMPYSDLAHYIAAKAGVIGLTRALSVELGEHGITINAISPGLTKTERTVDIPQEVWNFQVALQAIRRPEVPDDLTATVVFLASDDAAFITGQTICVDGGFVKH
jgi:NAD(P)-dependent dehydrogenase (short-subunit alcohol dehydrogenase family)